MSSINSHQPHPLVQQYFANMESTLRKVLLENSAVEDAARAAASALANDGVIHIVGTGHSHMLAEEAFYRAGGLIKIDPVLDTGLMLHESPLKSTYFERLPGYAEVLLKDRELKPGDVVVVASNSGRNSVPVEAAQLAKAKGCTVVAITSLPHSQKVSSRAASGRKLYELADLVIDTQIPYGDACLSITGMSSPMGPLSSIVGIAALNSMLALTAQFLVDLGHTPDVFISANVDDAESNLDELERMYIRRVPARKGR